VPSVWDQDDHVAEIRRAPDEARERVTRERAAAMSHVELLAEVARALRSAKHVAVLTGAGVSAESGIPTFRDALTGLWARFRPEELATPEAFRRDPKLVWDWYAWRRALVANAQPNPGHIALAELERRVPRLTLVTQNVDGLHQRAGSSRVIELHGNLARVKCSREFTVFSEWEESTDGPPSCPQCGAPLRPDVVWFGEPLPHESFAEATGAATSCDVFLSVGTSALVEPAASLPRVALASGAAVVVVNPDAGTMRPVPGLHRLVGRAGEVLPELVRAAWPEASRSAGASS
jgi:NAD-dependent deacetylase